MAELLVKAVDAVHSNPEKDRRGCYKKGDIVEVRPDGAAYGTLETVPKFVIVKIPNVTLEAARQYMEPWTRDYSFAVLNSDLAADVFQLRIATSSGVSAGGIGGITRADVERFLDKWDATVDSFGPNSVVFTIGIFNAIKSNGFWGVDVSSIQFTDLIYSQAQGGHRVQAVYPSNITAENVESKILERGGTIFSHDVENRTVIFDILRSAVNDKFQEDVKLGLGDQYKRRQWYFSPDDVDLAINAGGIVTITAQQAITRVKNRLAE